jgi:hypothetical protein
MSTSEIVSGVFLAGDELLGVEQLSVGSSSDLINHGGFQIEEHTSGDVLASASLGEEGVESVIASTDGLVRWHLAVGLDAVLKAEQFPASVTDLDTSLADVDRDNFSHCLVLLLMKD